MSIIGLLILAITSALAYVIVKKTYDVFNVVDLEDEVEQLEVVEKQHKIVQQANKKFNDIENKRKNVSNFKNKQKRSKK